MGGTITISGGEVIANGGFEAAAIGGAAKGTGDYTIKIANEPVVIAKAEGAPGIGKGKNSGSATIMIIDESSSADLKYVLINAKDSDNNSDIANAEIKIDGGTYSTNEDGLMGYFTSANTDTYNYEISANKYNTLTGIENSIAKQSNTKTYELYPKTYRVIYDGNGNERGDVPAEQSYREDAEVTVEGNTGGLERDGYVFVGWNTESNGSGVGYVEGNTFDMGTEEITLYAKWRVRVEITTESSQVTSYGGSDGSITVTAQNGNGSYEYSKDNGVNWQSSNQFTGLVVGTYEIIARDSSEYANKSTVEEVIITQPEQVSIIDIEKKNVTSHGGSDGSITVTAQNGKGSYEYSKDNGANWQESNEFTGLIAGIYEVVARDSEDIGNKSIVEEVIIREQVSITDIEKKNVTSYGGSNGSITITAAGGRGNYEYSKDNGANWQASNEFTGLVAGTYKIIARDSEDTGNISDVSNVTIKQPGPPYTPSTNAYLRSLKLEGAKLTPSFKISTYNYKANVSNEIKTIDLSAVVYDYRSKMRINGESVPDNALKTIDLNPGENIITIKVTAENSYYKKTYTVTINREVSETEQKIEEAKDIESLKEIYADIIDLDEKEKQEALKALAQKALKLMYDLSELDFIESIIEDIDDSQGREEYKTRLKGKEMIYSDEYIDWNEHKDTPQPKDKSWTVTFNSSLDGETIKEEDGYIRVVDEDGYRVEIELIYDEETKTLKIVPVGDYKHENKYYLILGEKLRNDEEKVLNKLIRMEFIID